MKHLAKPLEFGFASDSFRLEVQQTTDGERLAEEQRRLEHDRRASQVLQAILGPAFVVSKPSATREELREIVQTNRAFFGELAREQGLTFDGEPSYELSEQDRAEMEAENRHRAHFQD